MTVISRKSSKLAILAVLVSSSVAAPAFARNKQITPYIEIGQVATLDLKNGGDVLTYSTVAAGIDAQVTTDRAEFQVNYRYERRFDYQKDVGDQDVHTGLARARIDVVPNLLSMEAGAIATRVRSDIRGAAPSLLVGNVDNVTQVYSAYAGPSLATRVGPLDVAAAYRVGYTKAEDRGNTGVPVGQPVIDSYDHSLSHFATASVGMESGVLPFGWTVSGGYERENAGQLGQRFENKYVRGDVTVPVTPTVALVGGVGYEDIKSSQKQVLLDVNGNATIDGKGRFVADPVAPRLLSYAQDDIFWDAGVLWRPSRRTSLEARVGRRYGSMSYTGSLSWQANDDNLLQIGVYDSVETFGQQLNDGLAVLPTRFGVSRNALANNFGGCIFGGGAGGGCLNDAFQSASTAVYRSRGVAANWSAHRGPWSAGLGVGYNQRKFFAPTQGTLFTVNGLKDESWYAQGNVERALTQNSGLSGDVYVSIYNPGEPGAPNVLSTGATGSYYHTFGERLSASASLGLYSFKQESVDSSLTAAAQLGMRYSF
jgi:hypothetical protein